MHRLYNYGSTLQAYALQYIIEKIGLEVEIIDYNYPNSYQYERGIHPPKNDWKTKIIRLMGDFHPYNRICHKFQAFWSKYFSLSHYFADYEQIHKSRLTYDLCVTGSDQVWNTRFTKGDTTFLLDFIDAKIPKVSYASSFSTRNFNNAYKPLYSELLSQYKEISVRERGGLEIVKELTGKNAMITVDPTLLLTASDWLSLVGTYKFKKLKRDKYLLLYVLSYAFNPAPYIYELAHFISEKLSLPIVAIGRKGQFDSVSSQIYWIDDAGPIDFVQLFANASVVVTSSFHGTAFAANFGKKVYSVVKSDANDDRISSFLMNIGLEKAIVPMDTPFNKVAIDMETSMSHQLLEKHREESMRYLRNAIINNL